MRGTRIWLLTGLVALLASAAVAAGCGSDDESTSASSSASSADVTTLTEGTLLVGSDTPYEPFEIGQPPNITGFDIDFMNAIAEKLGLTPELPGHLVRHDLPRRRERPVRRGRRGIDDHPGSREGRSTSPTRTTRPSRPSWCPRAPTSPRPTTSRGKIVGAQDGTTGETYAKDETDASEVRGFPEGRRRARGRDHRQVDAAIIDQPVAGGRRREAGRHRDRRGDLDRRALRVPDRARQPARATRSTRRSAGDQGRRHAGRPVPAVLLDRPARVGARDPTARDELSRRS